MDGAFSPATGGFAQWRRELPLSAAASVLAHGLLLGALLVLTPLRTLVAPPPRPISVELIRPDQMVVSRADTPQVVTAPASPIAAPSTDTVRLRPGAPLQPDLPETPTHVATQFYSANILKTPGMARIRQKLTTIADDERIVQLCNIEALEQIRRAEPAYDPDTLVSYAMAAPVTAGLTLSANGAAFRSRRKWFGASFTCTVAPGYEAVTAFRFKLGDPIPEDEWEAHFLNAEDADE